MQTLEHEQTNSSVQDVLEQLRRDPRATNPRVSILGQMEQMKWKNGGYPVDMYHTVLLPVVVTNEREEEVMAQAGFGRQYILREYPRCWYRRNMHPRFAKSPEDRARIHSMVLEAQRIELATVNPQDYIETAIVKNEEEEKKLLKELPNKATGRGPWVARISEIEAFAEGPEEDPNVTIAALQGQLSALKATVGIDDEESPRRRGRRRKTEESAA